MWGAFQDSGRQVGALGWGETEESCGGTVTNLLLSAGAENRRRSRRMNEPEQERLIETLVEQYRATLRRRLQRPVRTMTEIEDLVEEVSQEVDRQLEEAILERQPTPEAHENRAGCPQCAREGARYRGLAARTLLTRHGERTLWRRYYYCSACRSGFAPLDRQLGLDQQTTSPTLRQFAARLAAHLPFAEATSLLEALTGTALSPSTLERCAVAVGTALRAAQNQQAERHRRGMAPPVARKPRRLYVSVDGIFAPLRDPWKKDGSAGGLVCRFAECKTAVVYEARATPRGDEGVKWRAYTATLGKVEAFGPLVATLAHGAGQHFARELIFLADGEPYNWSLAATHFPEAIQIVDYMHAVSHLFTVAGAAFGEGAAAIGPWVAARKEELLADQVARVLVAIAALPAQGEAARAVVVREHGYFARNAERMRYGTFRRRGYQIATGVMEAGCKHVVHQRLDQAGMHWRQETAEAIVALRAALLSSQPPDLRPYCGLTC
jgi:hypothetical protein